jgi:predicted nucleic acid-binding protein
LTRVYLDSNIVLYAIGEESRFREPCRMLLRRVVNRELVGETSVLTVQEVVHHRQRRGDAAPAAHGRDVLSICAVAYPLDRSVVQMALTLMDGRPRLGTADAIHAATALAHGIETVISADSDFDSVAGIERVDPLDGARLAALAND